MALDDVRDGPVGVGSRGASDVCLECVGIRDVEVGVVAFLDDERGGGTTDSGIGGGTVDSGMGGGEGESGSDWK